MIRTTVRLPDDLLETAKERARLTGRSLTQLLEDAVRADLSHSLPSARVAERSRRREEIAEEIAELQMFLREQPDRDGRSADEIIGHDAQDVLR